MRTRNYRLFITGQLLSNTGAWVQRIAQDWLVLTLTGSATAVGITTGLQFLPTLLFGLVGGAIADRYPKRRTLLLTQVGMSAMAAALAALTLSHQVRVWQVYVVAFGLGTVIAIDNPTRQSFVNEMVGPRQLRNAISLNASVFQLGALIGPAISGLLIRLVGPGFSFTINAVSYLAPMTALILIRNSELHLSDQAAPRDGGMRAGLRRATAEPNVLWPTILAGIFGLFTINLPVTLAAYAKQVFDTGATGYGMLSSLLAVGSLTGALLCARRPPAARLRSLTAVGAALAVLELATAMSPGQLFFHVLLVAVGAATLIFLTTANATVQLAADSSTRGRVMGLYLLVFIGSGAIGGPVIGYIDQHFGASTGLFAAGFVHATATAIVATRLLRRRRQQFGVPLPSWSH